MILVTGGTGFLGAHLLADLTLGNIPVRAIRRPESSLAFLEKVFHLYAAEPEKQLSRIEWINADLLDIFSLENALEGVTQVYHCAAKVSFVKKDRRSLVMINTKGTTNLVNLCLERPHLRLCHVSSIAAIGRSRLEESIAEDRFWKNDPNNSWYAITKYNAEREVWRGIEEGLNAFIVNPSVILGYSPWDEGSGKLFSRVWKGMKYYTEGVTGWVDVRDVVRIMITLMESGISGERFIVSAGNLSYREMFGMIAAALNRRAPASKASKLAGALAWRLEKIRSAFTGDTQLITRETAVTAQLKCFYENDKLLKAIDFQYTPLEETVKNTAKLFLAEQQALNQEKS